MLNFKEEGMSKPERSQKQGFFYQPADCECEGNLEGNVLGMLLK